MRYLLIDDDSMFSSVLSRALARRGHKTATAETSEQALAECHTFKPDRIVLDLKLAQESGLSILKKFKEEHEQADIIILTGYSSIPTAVESIKLGAINYLCKPAGVEEIISAFEKGTPNTDIPVEENPPSINRLEWEHIQKVLQENNGNISATARSLGMHRRTLQRKLQKKPVLR